MIPILRADVSKSRIARKVSYPAEGLSPHFVAAKKYLFVDFDESTGGMNVMQSGKDKISLPSVVATVVDAKVELECNL